MVVANANQVFLVNIVSLSNALMNAPSMENVQKKENVFANSDGEVKIAQRDFVLTIARIMEFVPLKEYASVKIIGEE